MTGHLRAAAIHLWYQDGNQTRFEDARAVTQTLYLDRAAAVIEAWVGDRDLEKAYDMLGQIADAWNNGDKVPLSYRAEKRYLRAEWPELADLLDGLVEGNEQ